MILRISFSATQAGRKITNPSVSDIREEIEKLDNYNSTTVTLDTTEKVRLLLAGGNNNRIFLIYTDDSKPYRKQSTYYLDPSLLDSEEEILICISTDCNEVLLRNTASREVAEEIALYFAEHHRLLPGHMWEGTAHLDEEE